MTTLLWIFALLGYVVLAGLTYYVLGVFLIIFIMAETAFRFLVEREFHISFDDPKYDYLVPGAVLLASIVWPLTWVCALSVATTLNIRMRWEMWKQKPSVFGQIITSLLGRLR